MHATFDHTPMYTIRFTPYRPSLATIMARQTAGWQLLSRDGRYRFVLDDGSESADTESADFWAVQGKGVRRPLHCRVARANVIHFGTEPRSVLVYPQRYVRQFAHSVLLPPLLPWFVGYGKDGEGHLHASLDYDRILEMTAPPQKKKLLSVITSDKAFTRGHMERIRFVTLLKQRFGDRIDVFGHGFRDFNDKWDVLAPYRYHVVIENSSEPDYWTEKVSDCYLAGTFPIYYGCTNLADYFPTDSFIPIDIRRPDEAVARITRAMQTKPDLCATAALAEAKRKVMDEYNLFERIAKFCDTLRPDAPKELVTLKPCHSIADFHNVWHYMLTRHYWQWRLKLSGLKGQLLPLTHEN